MENENQEVSTAKPMSGVWVGLIMIGLLVLIGGVEMWRTS